MHSFRIWILITIKKIFELVKNFIFKVILNSKDEQVFKEPLKLILLLLLLKTLPSTIQNKCIDFVKARFLFLWKSFTLINFILFVSNNPLATSIGLSINELLGRIFSRLGLKYISVGPQSHRPVGSESFQSVVSYKKHPHEVLNMKMIADETYIFIASKTHYSNKINKIRLRDGTEAVIMALKFETWEEMVEFIPPFDPVSKVFSQDELKVISPSGKYCVGLVKAANKDYCFVKYVEMFGRDLLDSDVNEASQGIDSIQKIAQFKAEQIAKLETGQRRVSILPEERDFYSDPSHLNASGVPILVTPKTAPSTE